MSMEPRKAIFHNQKNDGFYCENYVCRRISFTCKGEENIVIKKTKLLMTLIKGAHSYAFRLGICPVAVRLAALNVKKLGFVYIECGEPHCYWTATATLK